MHDTYAGILPDPLPSLAVGGVWRARLHLPRVCRTLVPEIRARPEMLRVIRYIDVLTCVIYNWNSKDDWSYSCLSHSVCREEYRRRQVGECADTWYKRIQPSETVEL